MGTELKPFPKIEQVKRGIVTVEEVRGIMDWTKSDFLDVRIGEEMVKLGVIAERFGFGESRLSLGRANGMPFWERSLGLGIVFDEEKRDFWALWARELAYYQPGLEMRQYLFERVDPRDNLNPTRVYLRLIDEMFLEGWYGGGEDYQRFRQSKWVGGHYMFWSQVERRVLETEGVMKREKWASLFDLPLTAEVEVQAEIV